MFRLLFCNTNDFFVDAISCSHSRAVDYFIESINSYCSFLAFPCLNYVNMILVLIKKVITIIIVDRNILKKDFVRIVGQRDAHAWAISLLKIVEEISFY